MYRARANYKLVAALLLFAGIPALRSFLKSDDEGFFRRSQDPEAVEQRNRSAFAVILGEFRTSLGDLIFLKTERYLDSGVAYAPHIDATRLEATGDTGHEGHDHDHDHDHGSESDAGGTASETTVSLDRAVADPVMREAADIKVGEARTDDHDHGFVPTIIRTADKDFRGFIGQMEREVKPWRDPGLPHQHTAGTELLPWYRIGTLADPHNVRMYIIGSWWLKTLRSEKQLNEALKFLDEGLKNNPDNFQILYMRGYVLRELKRDEEAQRNFRKSAEAGLKARPENWDGKSANWDLSKQEQLEAAMLMDVLYERDTRGTTAALDLASHYAERIPPPSSVHRIEDDLARQIYGELE